MWIRRQTLGVLFPNLLLAAYLLLIGCGRQTGGNDLPNLQAGDASQATTTKSGAPTLTVMPTPPAMPSGLLGRDSAEEVQMPPGFALSPTFPLPAYLPVHPLTPGPAPARLADHPPAMAPPDPRMPAIIGYSAGGQPIFSYRLGQGSTPVVLVGGIHGGYEWNTILLAYKALDYFLTNPEKVPQATSLYIIPSANPDGQHAVTRNIARFSITDVISDTVPGRFNGNGVDLNRNWDCQWQPSGIWQGRQVSGGDRPFSEPESRTLSQYLLELEPAVVLFFHSDADGVYAAGCTEIDEVSYELAIVYGLAAGYPINGQFQHYPVTGDAGSWFVTKGIPSVTVELKTHEDLDWQQNLQGIMALLDFYEGPQAEPSGPYADRINQDESGPLD